LPHGAAGGDKVRGKTSWVGLRECLEFEGIKRGRKKYYETPERRGSTSTLKVVAEKKTKKLP